MRLFKTNSHTSNSLAVEPGNSEERQLKKTQSLQQGKPPIKNLPRTAGMAGGGQKRLYGKKTNENPLWQGKPLSKGRGTQALLKEIRDTENLSPTVGMAGVG